MWGTVDFDGGGACACKGCKDLACFNLRNMQIMIVIAKGALPLDLTDGVDCLYHSDACERECRV